MDTIKRENPGWTFAERRLRLDVSSALSGPRDDGAVKIALEKAGYQGEAVA